MSRRSSRRHGVALSHRALRPRLDCCSRRGHGRRQRVLSAGGGASSCRCSRPPAKRPSSPCSSRETSSGKDAWRASRCGWATATAILPPQWCAFSEQRRNRTRQEQPGLSDRFIAHMLTRNIRNRRGPRRCAVQLERKTAGADVARARAIRQGGQTPPHAAEGVAGSARGNGRHNARCRVNFFMNISGAGVHRLNGGGSEIDQLPDERRPPPH